jgi:hypothetical protein
VQLDDFATVVRATAASVHEPHVGRMLTAAMRVRRGLERAAGAVEAMWQAARDAVAPLARMPWLRTS